jgi:hypothetical protein
VPLSPRVAQRGAPRAGAGVSGRGAQEGSLVGAGTGSADPPGSGAPAPRVGQGGAGAAVSRTRRAGGRKDCRGEGRLPRKRAGVAVAGFGGGGVGGTSRARHGAVGFALLVELQDPADLDLRRAGAASGR